MITSTALVALLALGWLVQNLWKRVANAAKEIVETKTATPAPVRAP